MRCKICAVRSSIAVSATLAIAAIPAISAHAQNAAVSVSINANANKLAINPNIYGVAYATTANLTDLNAPLNRLGGDDMSCYNWQLNASNKGSDWYFESIADDSATAGERGDTFISSSKAASAQSMITIPMLGWVAKLGADRGKLDSFSIAKYGAQTGSDSQYMPDAGNGVLSSTGLDVTGNDPNDSQTPSTTTFEDGWINHIVSTWGAASGGGVSYYLMDNEPSIWQGTHRDVHPIGAKMDEILDDIIAYGGEVKAADPTALVVGPEEWGWTGYLYSGFDQQAGAADGWTSYPDSASHGNMLYIPYLLQQLAANNVSTGKRILDVLSVHCYPQGGEFGNDVSTTTQLLRNTSTRQLWDPNYVDQSWIGTQVDLIPRLKGWVSTYYPGTKTAITEYNWGAEANINGATAQADVLGIFGTQGLDLATRWTVPDPSTPTYKAMKLYRNYDGAKSTFGDVSVSDTVPNPDDLSSFAAIRSSDQALTVMVINKVLTGTTPVTLNLANFAGNGTAQVWQLTSANAITQLASATVTNNALSFTAPPQSITLFILPPSGVKVKVLPAPTGLMARGGNGFVDMAWNAEGATSYNVERKTGTAAYAVIGHTSGTTYTDHTVTNATEYTYVITAVNSAGTSSISKSYGVTPEAANYDKSHYNFETSTQGWVSSGGMISGVSDSLSEVYRGVHSLAVSFNGAGADSQTVSVSTPGPDLAAGTEVFYHVFIPTGSGITSIQPYVQQGASGGWTWTGAWTPIASLHAGTWNTLHVTVPANAVLPLYSLGVQFTTGAGWTGTCYVDSVTW